MHDWGQASRHVAHIMTWFALAVVHTMATLWPHYQSVCISSCIDAPHMQCTSHAYLARSVPCLCPPQLMQPTLNAHKVAYQGVPGAYSEVAARKSCPTFDPLPCEQFEVAFQVGGWVGGVGNCGRWQRVGSMVGWWSW